MTIDEFCKLFEQLEDHQSIRLKALREARAKTGEAYPVIKDRRQKIRMIQEKEADEEICKGLYERLKEIHGSPNMNPDNPEIEKLFL